MLFTCVDVEIILYFGTHKFMSHQNVTKVKKQQQFFWLRSFVVKTRQSTKIQHLLSFWITTLPCELARHTYDIFTAWYADKVFRLESTAIVTCVHTFIRIDTFFRTPAVKRWIHIRRNNCSACSLIQPIKSISFFLSLSVIIICAMCIQSALSRKVFCEIFGIIPFHTFYKMENSHTKDFFFSFMFLLFGCFVSLHFLPFSFNRSFGVAFLSSK